MFSHSVSGGFLGDVLRGHVDGVISPEPSVLGLSKGPLPPVVDLGDRAATTLGSLAFIGPSWTSADGLPAPEVVCASHDVPQSLAEETAVLLYKTAITVFRAILLDLHSILSSFKGDALQSGHFQMGGRFRSWQNRSSTPQWGKTRAEKRGSSRDECLTEPLFSFYL